MCVTREIYSALPARTAARPGTSSLLAKDNMWASFHWHPCCLLPLCPPPCQLERLPLPGRHSSQWPVSPISDPAISERLAQPTITTTTPHSCTLAPDTKDRKEAQAWHTSSKRLSGLSQRGVMTDKFKYVSQNQQYEIWKMTVKTWDWLTANKWYKLH